MWDRLRSQKYHSSISYTNILCPIREMHASDTIINIVSFSLSFLLLPHTLFSLPPSTSLNQNLMAESQLTPIPLLKIASRAAKLLRIPSATEPHRIHSVPFLAAASVGAAALELGDLALGVGW